MEKVLWVDDDEDMLLMVRRIVAGRAHWRPEPAPRKR